VYKNIEEAMIELAAWKVNLRKSVKTLSNNIAYNPTFHADYYRETVFYRFFQLSESAYCLYKKNLPVGHKIENARSSRRGNNAHVEFGFSHNKYLIASNMSAL